MPLSIEYDGALTLQAQAQQTALAVLTISALAVETDPTLALQNIAGFVDWGDGTPQTAFTPSEGNLPLGGTHSFPVGTHFVTLQAHNFRYPSPDTAQLLLQVVIAPPELIPGAPSPIFIGPILPRDLGYPNEKQWNFNIAQDERILESSIKMLLLTRRGERRMRPSYGTSLTQYLFRPNLKDVQGEIADEVRNAIATFEPRVTVLQVTTVRSGTTVFLNLVYGSRFTNQQYTTSVSFDAPTP